MNPSVSIGIPVYNGMGAIERLMNSILSQTFQDFEIIVSDNGSTDGTRDYLSALMKSDSRIRCVFQEKNIGSLLNFNETFKLSRGRYFRWIGSDDWLEPSYLEECINVLEANPDFIGVTCSATFWYADGNVARTVYKGERLESPMVQRRFSRLMWFHLHGLTHYSPLSVMYRREAMQQSSLFQLVPDADFVFVAEMCLMGPSGHVSQHLVNRNRPVLSPTRQIDTSKALHPEHWKRVNHNYAQSFVIVCRMLARSSNPVATKIGCFLSLCRWFSVAYPVQLARRVKLAIIRIMPKKSRLVNWMDRPKAHD